MSSEMLQVASKFDSQPNNRQLFVLLGAACSMRNVRVTNELSVSNAVAGK